MTTIWWIRRDLRLADNVALAHALARGATVIPVFVADPRLLASPHHCDAGHRRRFLAAGLRALDGELRARGSRLVVRTGDPAEVLARLVSEAGAAAVVAEGDVSPYARRRDAAVRCHVPLDLMGQPAVHHPADVVKADGTPYTVFTPFRRAWLARPLPHRGELLAPPERLRPPPPGVASEPLPSGEAVAGFPAGEVEARRRLDAFTRGRAAAVHRYETDRDRVDVGGTSQLSPYLRFGMVSARSAVVAALEARDDGASRRGADAWLTELVWREFYLAVLFHTPRVLVQAFDTSRDVAWRHAEDELAAWRRGATGYPLVDAAMRELAATGWMANRARMVVASFLAKDLLVDWRRGEAWFMAQLVDGDPAANNGGWQWAAGVGTDAAPYFRVFNPVLQAKRCDPNGDYVRRWVPELRGIPGARVHEPWMLTPLEQQAAGCIVGRDYPAPIVDHRAARERALAAYRGAREEARR